MGKEFLKESIRKMVREAIQEYKDIIKEDDGATSAVGSKKTYVSNMLKKDNPF